MIIVKNRELLIPLPERYLGTSYDTSSEIRQFRVPRFAQNGVDLSALTFRLDIKYPNNTIEQNTVYLQKEVTDDFIILQWDVTSSVLGHPGTMFIQLRATDLEMTIKWSSFKAAMYVEWHFNTPQNYSGSSLTEIEQMEQDHVYMKGVVDELKSNLDYAHDAEAWAKGTRSGSAVPSTDDTYHNNSKYFSDQASAKATQAANSATAAANSATQAAETVADTNTRFNNAMAAVTSETEVIDARVGADGTQYTVLKNRLDAEHTQLKNAIDDSLHFVDITSDLIESGQWENNTKVNTTKRLRLKERIPVTKGTIIRCVPGTLYASFAVYVNNASTIALESTVYVGTSEYLYECRHDGMLIINIANATTYAASTTIAVSDYDMTIQIWQNHEMESRFSSKMIAPKYVGSKVSFLGDSITSFDGMVVGGYNTFYPNGAVRLVDSTWWMQVIRSCDLSIDTNASYSGSRVTDTNTYPDFYARCNLLGNPDIIYVGLGTGDSAGSVALGEYDFDTAYVSLSESEFRPAYIKGVKALQATYPNATIYILIFEMLDAYADSIKHIAKTLGILAIDMRGYDTSDGTHPTVDGMRTIANRVLYPVDATLCIPHVPADAEKVGIEIEAINRYIDTSTEYLPYEKKFESAKLSMNGVTGKISNNNNCRTLYIPCSPNTTYKIQKTAGGRFAVGCSPNIPANGATMTKVAQNPTASQIVFTTDDTAQYLVAFVYYETTDTGITATQMLDSVRISVLTVKRYNPHTFALVDGNRSIYYRMNVPFYKAETELTGYTIQSVVYKNPEWIVFSSEEDAVIIVNQHGRKTAYPSTQFGHVMSAELLSDGTYLVASADENYGTASETRKVYFYDLDTDTITDSFTPTISGNLVYASQINADTYYLIAWVNAPNDLHFYNYIRSTDTATEIGSFTAERTYLQGGGRINNLLYLSINDGWNSATDALVKIIDKDTLTVIDTITLKNFKEVEGFNVQCDADGNVYAYFGDAKTYSLYCARLS